MIFQEIFRSSDLIRLECIINMKPNIYLPLTNYADPRTFESIPSDCKH